MTKTHREKIIKFMELNPNKALTQIALKTGINIYSCKDELILMEKEGMVDCYASPSGKATYWALKPEFYQRGKVSMEGFQKANEF